jgi:phenylalanyl-tRNA synthetase beta chain
MQFSKNWLKDFIDIDLSTEIICSQLTMAGLEVDGYEDVSSKITGKDSIIKLDITPNRGDCFSVLGVARELSVINNLKLSLPNISSIESSFKDEMKVKACAEAPSYFGRTIRDISVNSKTLPLIAERLKFSDQKLIDPVVDITNYILLELGQPLHAFDRDKLRGNITVRTAFNKEKIRLLDDQELVLDDSCLVISDEESAVAFAGIMGGKESAVSASTNSIFLESAFFKPSIIRGKARRYGFQTDASLRFERGVDYKIQEIAIDRASILLRDTVGGRFSEVTSSTLKNQLPKQTKINLDLEKSNDLLGTKISQQVALRYFKGLGFVPEILKNSSISAIPPSWRYDLTIEADLVEELARLEGYDSLPQLSLSPVYKKIELNSQSHLSDLLSAKGFNEIISYSFISRDDHDLFGEGVAALEVKNPISQNMSVMRTNLVSGLVSTFLHNLNHGQDSQRLFEIGNIFSLKNTKEVVEKNTLAGLMNGKVHEDNWKEKAKDISFYDLKGVVQDLVREFKGPCVFENCKIDFLHPGMSSLIKINNKVIGFMGSLQPTYLDRLGLNEDIYIFSLDLEGLQKNVSSSYKEFSKFPSSSRDLSFIVNKSISSSSIENVIKSAAGKFFKDIEIFDVYEGKGIEEEKKSIAISVSWQSTKQTLKDYDIDSAVERIVNSMKKELGGELRV